MVLETLGLEPMLGHKIKQHPTFFHVLFGFRESFFYLYRSISLSQLTLSSIYQEDKNLYSSEMRIQFFEFGRLPRGPWLWSLDAFSVPSALSILEKWHNHNIWWRHCHPRSHQIGTYVRYWKLKSRSILHDKELWLFWSCCTIGGCSAYNTVSWVEVWVLFVEYFEFRVIELEF